MADKQYFERVDAYTWELPKWFDARMQVPVRLYCNEQVFDMAFRDKSIPQLINVSMLPGILKGGIPYRKTPPVL